MLFRFCHHMLSWAPLAAFFLAGSMHGADLAEQSDHLFTNHVVPFIQIRIGPDAMAALRNKFREYVRATVTEGSTIYRDVGIHLKGQYGTFQGIDGRPSLTLNFDKYVRGQRFHGLDKLHLNNSAQDPTYLCEVIGRDLFRAGGVPVARATHARLELNDRNLGLYVLIEGYDTGFLKRHFQDSTGNLYDSEFQHDITDPLRRSSGDGRGDHSDLAALVRAAEIPEPEQRMEQLSKLLDLDRFYSMLALELMMRHQDGYAVSINNYWLYEDQRSRKAVFLPHGMDQLFYEPHAPLLPELKGVLALAVLRAQPGLREFRARCPGFYTNLFLTLPNRLVAAQAAIRPLFAQMSSNAVARHDQAVSNLLGRIRERAQFLREEVFARAERPQFNDSGVAQLSNWTPSSQNGHAILTSSNGSLRIQLPGAEKSVVGLWQARVLLEPGLYETSTRVRADQAIFRGPVCPVTLKLWGIQDLQMTTVRTDATTVQLGCGYQVTVDTAGEHVIECEARGAETSAVYEFGSVRLERR